MAAQLEVNACEITKLILQYFEETDLSKSCSACATETQVQTTTQRVFPPNITVVHPNLPVLSCVLSSRFVQSSNVDSIYQRLI